MDLPAGVISISTPVRSSSGSSSSSGSAGSAQRLAVVADRGGAARVLVDEPQPPAAAGEELLGELLEVGCSGRERLLERLADLTVRVAHEGLELAQRRLEIGALALELLDVRERLVVLGLRERVDRAELLAPAGEPLDPGLQVVDLLVRERLGGRRGLEAQQACEPRELVAGVGGLVAQPLRSDLGAHQRLAVLAQRPLGLRLAGGAVAQALGVALACAAVGGQLGLERLDAVGHRAGDAVQRGGETLGDGDERAVGRGAVAQHRDLAGAQLALAGGALGDAALGGQLALELCAAHGGGALLRRLAALLDEPAGAAGVLLRGGPLAVGVAQRSVGGLAGAVGLGDRLARALGGGARRVLATDGGLGRRDELVAAVALGQDALLAALGGLPELARPRRSTRGPRA